MASYIFFSHPNVGFDFWSLTRCILYRSPILIVFRIPRVLSGVAYVVYPILYVATDYAVGALSFTFAGVIVGDKM